MIGTVYLDRLGEVSFIDALRTVSRHTSRSVILPLETTATIPCVRSSIRDEVYDRMISTGDTRGVTGCSEVELASLSQEIDQAGGGHKALIFRRKFSSGFVS